MLKKIFQTATFKQSVITSAGTIINGVLGALFYIVLARVLGPANFGLLTISVAFLTMVADIADFGTNTGLVKFVTSHLDNEKQEAYRFLKLGLEIKLIASLVVLVVGFAIAPWIADLIFNKRELLIPLRLAIIGVGGALLFSYVTSSLQAFQKFLTWSFVNILINLIRLGFIFYLIFLQNLSLINSLTTYILLPFFGFFVGLLFLPTRDFLQVNAEWKLSKKFLNYNFKVAVFILIAAISSRLDTFLNGRLLNVVEVGIYGAASQLVSVIPQLISSIGVVVAPKFGSFTDTHQMLSYFKKIQSLVLGIAALGLMAIPVADFVIPQIYGNSYLSMIPVFNILVISMLIFLISLPLHNSIIYFFGKPEIFIYISAGHLFIVGILGYYLISRYGIMGTALTVLIGMIFNFLVPLLWFIARIKKPLQS